MSTDDTNSRFRKRRIENWIFLGLMYGFFYLSRYNLSAIQVQLIEQFGWSNTDYGYIVSAGMIVYGFSVFLNGPLSDKIGGKKAMLIGAAGAAFFNLLFGLSHLLLAHPAVWMKVAGQAPTILKSAEFLHGMKLSSALAIMASLWACNNYFQSFGALSIVKVNAAWFHVKERGRFAGIFGMMIQGGRALALKLGPLILFYMLPWEYVFYIPALLLIIMWVVAYFRIENSPATAGLGEYETGDESEEEAKIKPTLGFILRKIFAQKTTWIIAFTSMCLGMVRHSMDNWFVKYLSAVFNLSNQSLAQFGPYRFASVAMPFAAILGGIAAGNASDRIFSSRRAPVICIALLFQALCLVCLRFLLHDAWLACGMLAVISFFIQSAHSILAGTASMDFGGKKAVSTAAGFFDGAQYLAGAMVGVGMGFALDHYKRKLFPGIEFEIWPLIPIPFAMMGAIFISTLWNQKPKGKGGH